MSATVSLPRISWTANNRLWMPSWSSCLSETWPLVNIKRNFLRLFTMKSPMPSATTPRLTRPWKKASRKRTITSNVVCNSTQRTMSSRKSYKRQRLNFISNLQHLLTTNANTLPQNCYLSVNPSPLLPLNTKMFLACVTTSTARMLGSVTALLPLPLTSIRRKQPRTISRQLSPPSKRLLNSNKPNGRFSTTPPDHHSINYHRC